MLRLFGNWKKFAVKHKPEPKIYMIKNGFIN